MARRSEVVDYLVPLGRPALRPTANPVETFVRPTLAPSRSEELAAALTSLNDLRPGLIRETRRQADRELARGEELFEANRADYAEAVRTGSLPIGASPYVRRGYRISQLRTLASSYTVELGRALESSSIHAVDDPAQVEAFIRDFTTQFERTNGIGDMPRMEVDRHYRPHTIQAQEAFRLEQAQRNIELMEERRVRAFEQELLMALETSGGGDISGWINAAAEELFNEGIDHGVIEGIIMNTVGSYASARGSVSVANMLSGISVAGMPALGASPEGRALIGGIQQAAAVRAQRAAAQAEAEAEAAATTSRRDLERRIFEAYAAGDTETASALAIELGQVDPGDGYTWLQRADARADELSSEGRREQLDLLAGSAFLLGDPDEADAIARDMVLGGHIGLDDYMSFRRLIEETRPPEGEPIPSALDALRADDDYRDNRDHIERLISGETIYGAPTEMRDAAWRATLALDRSSLSWIERNRDPATGAYDPAAFREHVQSEVVRLRNNYLEPGLFTANDERARAEAATAAPRVADPGIPMPPSFYSRIPHHDRQ